MILFAGRNAQALWFLTRGTGVVALLLLTAVLLLGIASSLRWRPSRWPRFVVADLHRNLTLLAIAFVFVHVITSVADGFAPISLTDAVIPFVSPYRPIWLGLGAVAFDVLLALVVTSLLRERIGQRVWRLVHWLAYAAWPVALVHSLGTGSDGRFGWFAALALGCIGLVALAVGLRLLRGSEAVGRRVAAALVGVAIVALVVGWYLSGPLQPGWAARAGTPAALLRTSTTGAQFGNTAASARLQTPFDGQLDARLARSSDSAGNTGVSIGGDVRGTNVSAVLHLTLWGTATTGGGVSMSTSRVTFSPVGGQQYTGTVSALQGSQLVATLRNPVGNALRLSVVLQLKSGSATVTGSVHGETA